MISSKFIPILAIVAGGLISCARAATVYTPSVTLGSPPGSTSLKAWYAPEGPTQGTGGWAEMELTVSGSFVLSPGIMNAGNGHSWYAVSEGTVVGADLVASQTPFASTILSGSTRQLQLQSGQSFILGFWLDTELDNTPSAGDEYGWVKLSYTQAGGLVVLDSATSRGTPLIAGTTTIPEASAFAIGALSLGLIARRRRAA
ncbi:MAG: hypothetical protein JWO82_57 [Akkermansiaceae bacterium]|nr:hypothetical protein [Akkermansiaceae bacterium]